MEYARMQSSGMPSRWGRIFLPFALGYYLSYLLRTVNAVISPALTAELDLSAANLGLLTSTYFLAFGLAQIPVGIALEKLGVPTVLYPMNNAVDHAVGAGGAGSATITRFPRATFPAIKRLGFLTTSM